MRAPLRFAFTLCISILGVMIFSANSKALPPACANELRSIFSQAAKEGLVVHPDEAHTLMAAEFLKEAEEVYGMLPKEMSRPKHMTLELGSKTADRGLCNTATGNIVCEVMISDRLYARRGVEVLKTDLGIHAHELGHLISYENYHLSDPRLMDFVAHHEHPFFNAELEKAIHLKNQYRQAELEYDQLKDGIDQDLADQKFEASEKLKKEAAQAKSLFEKKRTFWQAYDEVFADLISVSWSKDPKIVARGTRDVFGHLQESRDFSVQRIAKNWVSNDVHDDFSPTRSHLWFHYLSTHPSSAPQLIGATHRALLHEIDATLANPKLYELSLAEKNQRFMDEIDRQMSQALRDF